MFGRSGVRGGTYVQGWILNFFGIYQKTHILEIPSFEIEVPIKLVNKLTGITKHLQMKSNWVSVSKVNETTYKPDVALCIVKKSEEKI